MVVVAAVDIRIEVMITGEAVMEAATITEYVYVYIYLYLFIIYYIYIYILLFERFFIFMLTYCLRRNHTYFNLFYYFKGIYIG